MGRVDGYNPHNSKKETAFTWTDVYEKEPNSSLPLGNKKFITFFCFVYLLLTSRAHFSEHLI